MLSEGSAKRWHSSLVLLEKPHWGLASRLSLSFLLFSVRVVAVRHLAGSQAKAKGCWIGTSQMPCSQGGCCDLPLWVSSKVSFLWECKLCIWRHRRDFYPARKIMLEHWVQSPVGLNQGAVLVSGLPRATATPFPSLLCKLHSQGPETRLHVLCMSLL